MSNFSDILNTTVDSIEKPKPLPVGSYLAVVAGPPEIGPIGQKQTLAAKYQLKILRALEDVDHVLLNDMGGIRDNQTVNHTLFLTADAAWRAKEFTEHCGVEGLSTLGEALGAVQGRQVIVKLKHRPSQDGTQLYSEIASTAKVD